MCTIGAVSNLNGKGERLGFLLKTIDAGQVETFHGLLRSNDGKQSLFSSIMRQPGTNIGMNEDGLAVTISYSDCWEPGGPHQETPKIENDTRALANAEILCKCSETIEGLEYLKRFVRSHPNQVGGNHLLIDGKGNIALLEQYKGNFEFQILTGKGYCGRANNSHWLIKEKQSKLYTPVDSFPREEEMESFLKEIHEDIEKGSDSKDLVSRMKAFFSRHSEREDHLASICAHGLNAPGARLFGEAPCYTLTAVILDVNEKKMHYSLGFPCSGIWQEKTI
jgi:hypothetical protein